MFGHDPHSRFGRPLCGCYWIDNYTKHYLPLVDVSAYTTILSTTSRTRLSQDFVNPLDKPLKELRYTFPLYDGVSVVAFRFTVAGRTVHGVVKERDEAKKVYDKAVKQGETAGLLTQSQEAADVFTTTIGNVPAAENVRVEIEYIGELKHDTEVDGVRFTIPTTIAPRYGDGPRLASNARTGKFEVTVDVDMPAGSAIKSVQSPSHPLSVSIGSTSVAPDADPSLSKASASLSLSSSTLEKDFIVQVVVTNMGEPTAVRELHPTLDTEALMVTLVPKFSLPPERPEIVFVCDRSGSMGQTIPDLVAALNIFLKSLPTGIKFNICSFGTRIGFLWERSKPYTQETLNEAVAHVRTFAANFGGTEMYEPLHETFQRRYKDMNLEVFLLTDGEIWDQERLFGLVNDNVAESKGAIRVFTLGIGAGVSTSLIEGVAKAGRGFCQTVDNGEKMDKKVVRMLKGALFPHVTDYTLEVKYAKNGGGGVDNDDGFELVEAVNSSLNITELDNKSKQPAAKPAISLFNRDQEVDDEVKAGDEDLPDIPCPKYLSIPTAIPPLFPFNRTTAYVLISGSSGRPTSVLLKGTCKAGPLELEIPISSSSEPGITIHQLAARKEMKELEEGRGWISYAKDDSGTLLKTRYDGKYSDLVQREAVRLGTTYQIVGKWTSFVAVEDKSDKSKTDTAPPVYQVEVLADTPVSLVLQAAQVQQAQQQHTLGWHKQLAQQTGGGGGLFGSFGSAAKRSAGLGQFLLCDPPPPSGAAFGAPAASGTTFGAGPGFGQSIISTTGFGSAPASYGLNNSNTAFDAAAPTTSLRSGSSAPKPISTSLLGSPKRAVAAPAPSPFSCGAPVRKNKLRRASGGATADPVAETSVDTSTPLHALVALQAFDGSWSWNSTLEALIKVTAAQAAKVAAGAPTVASATNKTNLLATACAIEFLKKRLPGDQEAWEMLVEKAQIWLEDQGVDVAALLQAVAELF